MRVLTATLLAAPMPATAAMATDGAAPRPDPSKLHHVLVADGASGSLPAHLQELPTPQSNGAVIDRIVAVVNEEVITLGQLERAVGLQRSVDGDSTDVGRLVGGCRPVVPRPGASGDAELRRPSGVEPAAPAAGGEAGAAASPSPDGGTAAADDELRDRVLSCLIDSLLVFQHVRRFPQVTASSETIDAAFQRHVQSYPSLAAFETDLQRWGLTVDTVREDLEQQLMVAEYVDSRFRAFADVRPTEVRRYYEETLVPEMQRRGAPAPPVEQVADDIERILREREVNRRIEEWIRDLRERSDIVVYVW